MNSVAPDLARLGDVVFRAPERIWIVAPVLLVLLLAPLMRWRGGTTAPLTILLRGLALLALAAVLLDPALPETKISRGRLLVLADVSPSVGVEGIDATREVLKGASEPYDLIPFGATPGDLQEQVAAPVLTPDARNETDLAAALRRATLRVRGDRPLRVVLVSDARATRPGASAAALRLRGAGADVRALAIPPQETTDLAAEFAVEQLVVPDRAERREPFRLTARVRSSGSIRAVAQLFLNGEPQGSAEVALEAGEQTLGFDDLELPPGRYLAQVVVSPDASPGDNLASLRFEVPGVPRVLCLAAGKRKALIADALAKQGVEVEVAAPAESTSFDGYDAVVVLPDAPADALDPIAPRLSEFVGRQGGGLLAIGGTEGPGLARLAGSPFSYLLPLEVEARQEEEQPTPPEQESADTPRIHVEEKETEAFPITLCLLVDSSGSMAGHKIERAKAAASAAAYALTSADRIAVISFGDTARVLMEPAPAGDPSSVLIGLAGLHAAGQTSMFAALELGTKVMMAETTPIRHLVLVSDGVPTDSGPWRDVIWNLTRNKITLSTVGIGFESDSRLLIRFASWGRGRYWSANQPHQIPQVVTEDTQRVVQAREKRGKETDRSKPKPPDEKPPEPEQPKPPEPKPEEPPLPPEPPPTFAIVADPGAPREMLKGIPDDRLPMVSGIEEGEPRFASWTAARAGTEGPPLLTYWRFGLGTAAVLTSDPEAPGNPAFRESEELTRLLAQLMRSIFPDARGEPFVLRWETDEETLRIVLLGEDGGFRTDLALRARVGDEELELVRRGGRHEATLPDRLEPVVVEVQVGDPEKPVVTERFLVPASIDRELERTGADHEALVRLAGNAERVDQPSAEALRVPERTEPTERPISLPFLLIAAILLPLDAWARRRTLSASR